MWHSPTSMFIWNQDSCGTQSLTSIFIFSSFFFFIFKLELHSCRILSVELRSGENRNDLIFLTEKLIAIESGFIVLQSHFQQPQCSQLLLFQMNKAADVLCARPVILTSLLVGFFPSNACVSGQVKRQEDLFLLPWNLSSALGFHPGVWNFCSALADFLCEVEGGRGEP